jgi:hypothetical protein
VKIPNCGLGIFESALGKLWVHDADWLAIGAAWIKMAPCFTDGAIVADGTWRTSSKLVFFA